MKCRVRETQILFCKDEFKIVIKPQQVWIATIKNDCVEIVRDTLTLYVDKISFDNNWKVVS